MGKTTTTSLRDIVEHPGEFYTVLKLIAKAMLAKKQIPAGPHWEFCYDMLYKCSRSLLVGLQLLDNTNRLRDVLCVFHMVIRAIDTVEDDTAIPMEVKVPILTEFHRHIYDPEWHFSCGSKKVYKSLMEGLHHVRAALLELESGYQQAIEDTTTRMGAGMAKFVSKEIETIDDYDEYCHCVAGLVEIGMMKVFHASGKEDLAPEALANAYGLLIQKMDIIMDYLEDINEKPKPLKFWPREIWSKYANKLEDFKYEGNSVKAVQCLNDMVTNALVHVEDSLKFISTFRDPSLFRLHGIGLIVGIGQLALFYNNIQVFRGVVRMRSGLLVKILNHTKTKSDVYGAVYDLSLMVKSKVEDNDPNAGKTKEVIEAILRTCRDSGHLDDQRKSYIIQSKPQHNATLVAMVFFILAVVLAYLIVSPPASV